MRDWAVLGEGTVGVKDLRGIFQTKKFYGSIVECKQIDVLYYPVRC